MFDVQVVSPESVSYTGEAEMVIARTVDGGDIAFQTGHVPFIGTLAVWSVDVVKAEGDRDTFAVHRGFVQVSGTSVTILSDVSEVADEIDVARAQAAKERAEAVLSADAEDEGALADLGRAELRLRVAAGEPASH
ncbi:MAG: ATP synthase F1 subunit epsilon [Acidimicrobiales bacterium]|jgi:F-type H+-transporting ATPase subunit epsilon|nr:ATP synthase F1 subunit epsilon [Acidimicrobiales bacterium]